MPLGLTGLTRLQTLRRYTEILTRAAERDLYVEAQADLGRRDLFYLAVYLLRRRDLGRHDWLFDRAREVQAAPDGRLDLWAREHGKSSWITFALTVQDILCDPEVTVGIFSHTRPIAKGFLRLIKREFEVNDELKAIYREVMWSDPRKEAPKWSEDDGIIVKRKGNPKEATVEAWGLVDGQPVGKHFLLRVYDDVVTRESVTTPEQTRKTTEAWELSDNLGARGGAVRYIGTRYDLADTYHEMMKRRVVVPRLHPATHDGTMTGRPVLLTAKELEEKRQNQGTQFAAQMLLNPAAGNERTFQAHWLKPWEVRPRLLNVYILGDPSKGRTSRSDRTAYAVVGIDSGGTKYFLDGMRHRMNLAQRWDALRTLQKRWSDMPGVQTVFVGYEEYGLQSDLEYFEERMRIERAPFHIQKVAWPREGGHSKEDRVGRLVPDLSKGRFRLPAVVWDATDGLCFWSIAPPLSNDERAKLTPEQIDERERVVGKLVLRPMKGDTALMMRAKAEGVEDTCASAIRRVDEERRVYDCTMALITEVTQFPFGLHDDLIDATSRVYDMDPVPPAVIAAGTLEPPSYEDGI